VLRVLVVTASRRLLDTPKARAWFERRLRRALRRYDVLVTGDASSDKVAITIAERLKLPWYSFALDGCIYSNGLLPDSILQLPDRWTTATPRTDHGWPLVRNKAMVEAMRDLLVASLFPARGLDLTLKMLGLRCPWATRHGTEHTLGLCDFAKRVRTCPARYSP